MSHKVQFPQQYVSTVEVAPLSPQICSSSANMSSILFPVLSNTFKT